MSGSTIFYLILYSTDLARRLARITNNLVDLFTILTEYYKFTNIFSKVKVETLASYYPYNLQIKLENRKRLPIRTIYLLSVTEQEALKEFISENLNTRFIYPTFSPYRVLVFFIKKDSSLCLNVDF